MNDVDRTRSRLQRVTAVFAALLIASTWKLWHMDPGAPQIPWLRSLCDVPRHVDEYALGALGLGLLGMLLRPQSSCWGKLSVLLMVLGLGTLVSLDQHRLQPWVWQFLLLGAVFLWARNVAAERYWRWITVSIYFHSALSKLDVAYLDEHGKLLLDALLRGIGTELPFWTPETRRMLPLAFPIAELLIAGLLLIPRLRWLGLVASVLMHGVLIWVLGFVLNHEWGVVIWNGYFIAQNLVLFSPRRASEKRAINPKPSDSDDVYRIVIDEGVAKPPKRKRERLASEGRLSWIALLITLAAIGFPFLERIGWCDHWPAWAVYSSRPEIVRVDVRGPREEVVPKEFRAFLSQEDEFSGTQLLNFDSWSYSTRHCPIYPQLRYRVALARAVLGPPDFDGHYTLSISSSPDPWTGRRKEIPYDQALLDSFFWNIEPRR